MTHKVSLLRVVISGVKPDMPNYHIFTFIPKSNKLFYPIKLGVIFTELFQKTLVTEPLDEDQIWEFDQKSFDLKIILKATD